MTIRLHSLTEETKTIGTGSLVFATIRKSGVGSTLTSPTRRVNNLTRLVNNALASNIWTEIIGRKLTFSERNHVWQVVNILLKIGSAEYTDRRNGIMIAVFDNGKYCREGALYFGPNADRLTDWCVDAVHDLFYRRGYRPGDVQFGFEYSKNVIMSVELAARFCLRDEDMARLPKY